MARFLDPLSGEPRELNYHGIKCRREPEDATAEWIAKDGPVDPVMAAHWAARMAEPGYAFGLAWANPVNRTQEAVIYFVGGQPYMGVRLDGDDFAAWHGAEEPPAFEGVIEVKFRDGWSTRVTKGYEKWLRWTHTGDREDILGFRVLP